MGKDLQTLSVTTGTMLRFLAILLLLALLYVVRDIAMALIFAVIIASAVEPGIEWLKQRRIPRILAVIIIYLGMAALFFFGIYLVVPLFLEEFRGITQTLPVLQQQVLDFLEGANLPFTPFFGENPAEFLRAPLEYLQNLSQGVFTFASAIFGGIFSFILIIVFSFYLLAQEKGIENFLRLVIPIDHEPYAIDLWQRAQRKLGQWFRAQMLLGAIVGVLIFFGLTFLGVRHALIFAVLAAAFEIIPIVGPILAAVPAVLVAFISSTLLGFLTIGLYVVVQQVESHIIVPVVLRKALGLSPLIVVLSLLVGAKIGGVFGILLAVPLAAILTELVGDWDKKKRSLITR
jgi:predicted PurR-regulated permease PerM